MANKLKNLLAGNVDDSDEPLMRKQLSDFIPNEDNEMNKEFKAIYEKMNALFWLPSDVRLVDDQIHMRSLLNNKEIHVIKFVVSFFANADTIVADNIAFNLAEMVSPFYVKANYKFIEVMEDIHAITYDKLMVALFPTEAAALKENVIKIPSIRRKIEFMAKWMAADCTFSERVVAFLCVEAILFSASFAIIFWFKTRGLLPGVIQANALILRDEGMHQDYGVLVHKYIKHKASAGRITEIIKEAIEAETQFINEALPEPIKDLTSGRIITYAQFVADRLAEQLGIPIIYGVVNPCAYMQQLGIQTKVNFFETNGTDYRTLSPDKTMTLLNNW